MQRCCATAHENHQWILRRSDNRDLAAPQAGLQSRDRERGHTALGPDFSPIKVFLICI